jgi:hypothetical protein
MRRLSPIVIAVAGLTAAVAVLAAFAATRPTGTNASSSNASGSVPADVTEGGHAGHGVQTAAADGVCSETYNTNIMHWNPTNADEMVALGCSWPYPPGVVSTTGGDEDSALDAAFEPRRYQEIWDLMRTADFGVCAVRRLVEPPDPGFVFGFDYPLEPKGCLDNNPTVTLTVSEYATRAQRDAALHASSSTVKLVLGRWVLEIDGDDVSAHQLAEALATIDAQAVPA